MSAVEKEVGMINFIAYVFAELPTFMIGILLIVLMIYFAVVGAWAYHKFFSGGIR